MATKVLVNQIGQHIIADVKQIENKETSEIVGYWLSQPRVVQYTKDEEDNIGVNFQPYCLISDEAEFSLRADHVVAILEPRDTVANGYTNLVYPPVEDGTDAAATEEPASDAGVADGAAAGGAESAPEAADGAVGEAEAVAEPVA